MERWNPEPKLRERQRERLIADLRNGMVMRPKRTFWWKCTFCFTNTMSLNEDVENRKYGVGRELRAVGETIRITA